MSSFDEIPEDRDEAYPCYRHCRGSIKLTANNWICDTCGFQPEANMTGCDDRKLTWEQKLDLLESLTEHSLKMRKPGDWYVSSSLEIGGNGLLCGSYGEGENPQQAVLNHWKIYCEDLAEGAYIVVDWAGSNRRQLRWNGYRFEEVSRKKSN